VKTDLTWILTWTLTKIQMKINYWSRRLRRKTNKSLQCFQSQLSKRNDFDDFLFNLMKINIKFSVKRSVTVFWCSSFIE